MQRVVILLCVCKYYRCLYDRNEIKKIGIMTLNLLSLKIKTKMRVNLKTYVYSSLEYWVTETYKNDWESTGTNKTIVFVSFPFVPSESF